MIDDPHDETSPEIIEFKSRRKRPPFDELFEEYHDEIRGRDTPPGSWLGALIVVGILFWFAALIYITVW